MNEDIGNPRRRGPERRPFLKKVAKAARDITTGVLLGYAATSVVQELHKPEGPRIEYKIPDKKDLKEVSSGIKGISAWISHDAAAFLSKSPIGADHKTFIKGINYSAGIKEIRIVMSSFNKSTLAFYYLKNDGKSGKLVTIRPREEGGFEKLEFDF